MSRQLSVTEAKATLLALLDEIADGEEVEIMKHRRLIARIVPARSARALRGRASAVATSNARDEELFRVDLNGEDHW